jgi:transcriptional regulator with PAS, ATPase and Fis domain
MPPLRRHKEDIPLLISHFLQQRTSPDTALPAIPGDIVEQLLAYEWPGNVRELFNELRRYLTTGELELRDTLAPGTNENLGFLINPKGKMFNDVIEEVEKRLIADALAKYAGNKVNTAEALQIPLRSLHRKIKKYKL